MARRREFESFWSEIEGDSKVLVLIRSQTGIDRGPNGADPAA